MAQVSYDFNTGDTTTIPNFAEDGANFQIESNVVTHGNPGPGSAYAKLRWTGSPLDSADNRCRFLCRSNNNAIGSGAYVRGAENSNVICYTFIGFGSDSCYLIALLPGENILATGSAMSSSVAQTLQIEAIGSNLEGFLEGASDATASDSNLASGGVGGVSFGTFNNPSTRFLDDFFAEDTAAVAAFFRRRGAYQMSQSRM